jgi:hypothetical protein
MGGKDMPPRDYFKGISKDEFYALFAEMRHASDRVAAVSCAAYLDDTLGWALSARFVVLGKRWEGRLFSGSDAPLGTLSAKVRLGYALALYGPITCADLGLIREIRNDFAHTAKPLSFAKSDIGAKVSRLKTFLPGGLGGPFPPDDPKQIFAATAQQIAFCLMDDLTSRSIASPTFPSTLP